MKMNRKWIVLEILTVTIIISILLWYTFPLFLHNQNFNNSRNFPDPNFRRAIERFMGVEENGRFTESELESKGGDFKCKNLGITNVKGIEYLKSIRSFICSQNEISSLDLSSNLILNNLVCESNQIEYLNVSHNVKLRGISCDYNRLAEIDLSQNPKLTYLHIGSNQLKSLDLSSNPDLKTVWCSDNMIETIVLHKENHFVQFYCMNNLLTQVPSFTIVDLLIDFDIKHNLLECDDWKDIQTLTSIVKEKNDPIINQRMDNSHCPQKNLFCFQGCDDEPNIE